jgi:hypothetical protein
MWQIPAALAAMGNYRQFIIVRFVPSAKKPGKFDKFPVNPNNGEVWNAHDPAIWLDHHTAGFVADAFGPGHGVGFVFTEADPFFFLDIDNCATPEGWSEVAQLLCQALAGCALEVSSSGKGLHLFGVGPVPAHGCRNGAWGLELYTSGRFVALGQPNASGDAGHAPGAAVTDWLVSNFFPPGVAGAGSVDDEWRDAPVPQWRGPADDDELVRLLLAWRPTAGAAFGGRASPRDLWEANVDALARSYPDSGDRPYDASAADAALASHLAYFTGSNHDRVERLMQRSALRRDKWEREDYLRGTVLYACRKQTRWLGDREVASEVVPAASGLTFAGAAAAGSIPGTLPNVQNQLRGSECGLSLALDRFKDRIVLKANGSPEWAPFQDVNYVRLRTEFEERGFKPVKADVMKDAVLAVATEREFDSAIDWANSLQWDGVPRVELAMHTYFGCRDTPYTRAVAAYLFTALAGRLLSPGCQADMAVILVDPRQGTGKTSAVRALAPSPETFGEVDLAKIDHDDTARKLRGKLVVELSELRGLSSKEDESIKAWVSRRHEEFTPKFREFSAIYQRRCVLLGTSNRDDLLADATGNRRWLPVWTGTIDVEAITRDCEQLWAEAVVLWRATGVRWREAMQLAVAEQEPFTQVDPWTEELAVWLETPEPPRPGEVPSPIARGAQPFRFNDALRGALRLDVSRVGRREEKRASDALRRLGYRRLSGARGNFWSRP